MARDMRRTRSVGCGTGGDDVKYGSTRIVPESYQETRIRTLNEARSSKQVKAALTRPTSNRTGGLEDRRIRRGKRSAYNTIAAKESDPDMFNLPNGGCHENPMTRKEKVDPYTFCNDPAGLCSEKADKFLSGWIGDMGTNTLKPVYYPTLSTDPITHDACPLRCNVERDTTLVQGAAGVSADRLARLKAGVTLEIDDKTGTKQRKCNVGNGDIVTHKTDPPPKQKYGLKMFDAPFTKSSVQTTHKGGKPDPLPPEAFNGKSKMVANGTKYLYYAHGDEDMLPGATEPFNKADRPPSAAHRRENDKRYLASSDRQNVKLRGNHRIVESADMHYIMGNAKEEAPYLNGVTVDWSKRVDAGTRTPRSYQSTRSLQPQRTIAGVYRDPSTSRPRQRPATARQAYGEASDRGHPQETANRRRYRSATPPRSDVDDRPDRTRLRSLTPRGGGFQETLRPRGYAYESPRRSRSEASMYSDESGLRYAWSSPK